MSELIEAHHKAIPNAEKFSAISSDDVLHSLTEANEMISNKGLVVYDPSNTDHADDDAETVILIASDIDGMFPNIEKNMTGEAIGEMISKSTLRLEGTNVHEMLLYILLNRDKVKHLE